jgi:ArsR family transcriptional regulator
MDDMAFKIKADFLKGLAHPIRLQIIEYLKNGEASVGKLVQELGVEQSNLSRHLATLRDLGILEARQEKTSVYYYIHDPDIFKVLRPVAELLRKKLKKSEKILKSLGKG